MRGKPFDILLLDLIDERFRVFRDTVKGTVCTLSSEFMNSGIDLKALQGRTTPPGTAMDWWLWEEGWKRLVKVLQGQGLLDRLRINRVFWNTQTDTGGGFPAPYDPKNIASANQLLALKYQKTAVDISEQAFYDYLTDVFVAATNHRWGSSPFHYVKGYYQQAIEKLNNEPRRN